MRSSSAAKRWRQRPCRPRRRTFWRPSAPRMVPMTSSLVRRVNQPRRFIVSNLAFEVGDELEEETDQPECGFGAVEGVQAEAACTKVVLEFLDAVFAFGAAVVEAPGLPRVMLESGG